MRPFVAIHADIAAHPLRFPDETRRALDELRRLGIDVGILGAGPLDAPELTGCWVLPSAAADVVAGLARIEDWNITQGEAIHGVMVMVTPWTLGVETWPWRAVEACVTLDARLDMRTVALIRDAVHYLESEL